MNLQKELRSAIDTGKVVLGSETSTKAVKDGRARLIIVANNFSKDLLKSYKKHVDVYEFEGDSVELGTLCKKPFAVSSLAIIEQGGSKILGIK